MSAKLVYVAAPYSHPDPAVIAARMACFDAAIASLLKTGDWFPVSPLMNHSILGRHALPGDWDFWQHYSRRLLARCDVLHVLKLPHYLDSVGVRGEIDLAQTLSLPISYASYDEALYEQVLTEARLSRHQG